jgi:hypothetical protein
MKNRRRDLEIFSLSFLDCICCGFGAIILLFVLSKFAEPVVIEKIKENMQSQIVSLKEELFEIRGQTQILIFRMLKANSLPPKMTPWFKILLKANWPGHDRS